MKRSRRYREIREKIDKEHYSVNEAVKKIQETATAKFDESVEISIVLGVDPKKSDQMVRGNVVLPHGTGKALTVAVAAEGKDADDALKAGAQIAGKDKVIESVNKGEINFDVLIATPDCMKDLAKLGKVLGPKGLMPSPKSGTVVKNVADAVKRVMKGQVEFKMNKNGVINSILGKKSFPAENLIGNFNIFLDAVRRSRPSSAKGKFIKKVAVSSTMGPSIAVAA
jgi:large subunit ribosomal protein L1